MDANTAAALKAAVLGAQQIQAPEGNPLGASHATEQAAFNRSSFQLPQSNAASGASAFNTDAQVKAQKAQEQLDQQKKVDLLDPSKYKSVKKADGGYDFFDPTGNQVDIATLSQRTGTRPSDWIKDSENPIDTQYLEDTKNLGGLITAIQSKDSAAIAQYKKGFADNGLPDITGMKVQDIIDKYKQYYQRYYVTRQQNPNAWGTRPSGNPFVPAPQSAAGGLPGGLSTGSGDTIPGA